MTGPAAHFADPAAVADYALRAAQMVPGLAALHRMTSVLLAETAGPSGRVLVLGAGGGMELQVLARDHPGWHFAGVDPAAAMLDMARDRLGPLAARIDWHQGMIADAPDGPFDAACCLLTLHFLPPPERLDTLRQVHRRMRPGAALVVAHHSFAQAAGPPPAAAERPDTSADQPRQPAGAAGGMHDWLARFAAFAIASGADPVTTGPGAARLAQMLPIMAPEADADLLRAAGFREVALFYAAFTFRGWVAFA